MEAVSPSLLLLLLTIMAAVCARSLVLVNSGVQVPRGRMVFITNSELSIVADADADCKVEVVLNEPVTQRVGKLSPQVRGAWNVAGESAESSLCSVGSAGV